MQLVLCAGLLQENAKLSEEKREVEKQLQKETGELQRRITDIEMSSHDMQAQYEQLLTSRKTENDDLQKQIHNLEKKLKSNQQFIEVNPTLPVNYVQAFLD